MSHICTNINVWHVASFQLPINRNHADEGWEGRSSNFFPHTFLSRRGYLRKHTCGTDTGLPLHVSANCFRDAPPRTSKTDEFSEKFRMGGVIFNPKICIASQLKKLQYNFPKMRGDSSENSSVLEVRGIPYGQCFVIFLKDLCLAMIMGKNPQKNYPL